MGGYAWVTLATNDSYSLGALVLAHSLKQANTAHQLAVLITPGVTNAMKEKLTQVFNIVQEVNVLDSRDEANLRLLKRPELGVTFTKLHCWRLTQFDKCVFLDADTLVLQNSDELFDRDEFSAAPDVGWPDCFNSGVFVYKPSLDTHEKLIKFALEKGSFDGGDQGLLNLYFSDWAHKDISKHLPFIYNMCSTACYSYLPAFKQFGANAKIIHFIGSQKPWLQYFNTEVKKVQPSEDATHLQEVLQRWWDIFCSLIHPVLSPEMAGLAGAFSQLTLGVARTPEQDAFENLVRKQAWEVGNIDYLGKDSFENIWSKITETLTGDVSPPVTAVPPSAAAAPPAPVATESRAAVPEEPSLPIEAKTDNVKIIPDAGDKPPVTQEIIETESQKEETKLEPQIPKPEETTTSEPIKPTLSLVADAATSITEPAPTQATEEVKTATPDASVEVEPVSKSIAGVSDTVAAPTPAPTQATEVKTAQATTKDLVQTPVPDTEASSEITTVATPAPSVIQATIPQLPAAEVKPDTPKEIIETKGTDPEPVPITEAPSPVTDIASVTKTTPAPTTTQTTAPSAPITVQTTQPEKKSANEAPVPEPTKVDSPVTVAPESIKAATVVKATAEPIKEDVVAPVAGAATFAPAAEPATATPVPVGEAVATPAPVPSPKKDEVLVVQEKVDQEKAEEKTESPGVSEEVAAPVAPPRKSDKPKKAAGKAKK